jgi:hypothetical protein
MTSNSSGGLPSQAEELRDVLFGVLPQLISNFGWEGFCDMTFRQCLMLPRKMRQSCEPSADAACIHEPAESLRNFLDSTQVRTVTEAVVGQVGQDGRAPCIYDVLLSSGTCASVTRERLLLMIKEQQTWLETESPIPFCEVSLQHQLVIRVYTAKAPFPIFQIVNRYLNGPGGPDGLSEIAPFTRLLMEALLHMDHNYSRTGPGYRGLVKHGNDYLESKYLNHKRDYAIGSQIPFPAFTSISQDSEIAEKFGDNMFFHFLHVRAVDVSSISVYPEEKELLIIPPRVFRVAGYSLFKGMLIVNLTAAEERNFTYLSCSSFLFPPVSRANGGKTGFTDENLKGAVKDWYENRTAAELRFGHISSWDTSQVTNMNALFMNLVDFNDPIEKWDVSKVVDMDCMFCGATSFNQPLKEWKVSKVTTMKNMFDNPTQLKQSLPSWTMMNSPESLSSAAGAHVVLRDVQYVADNAGNGGGQLLSLAGPGVGVDVLQGTTWTFNETSPSSNDSDQSRVVTRGGEFLNNRDLKEAVRLWCRDETEALQIYGHITKWNTSKVTDMSCLFQGWRFFNEPIGNWDVSNVTNMSNMFRGAESFNRSLARWDVSNVTIMYAMFSTAKAFNQPLDSWTVACVTDMSYMFSSAHAFNHPLHTWVVSDSLTTDCMFFDAKSFCQDNRTALLDPWRVETQIRRESMFRQASLSSTSSPDLVNTPAVDTFEPGWNQSPSADNALLVSKTGVGQSLFTNALKWSLQNDVGNIISTDPLRQEGPINENPRCVDVNSQTWGTTIGGHFEVSPAVGLVTAVEPTEVHVQVRRTVLDKMITEISTLTDTVR